MTYRHLGGAAAAVCVGVLGVASCGSTVSGTGTVGATGSGGSSSTGTTTSSSSTATTTASTGAGMGDAGDDAGYLACMNASGQLDDSLKTCQADSDCIIEQEQTDCCGTILYVGVNTASAGMFDACEAAWLAHFPACGCDSGQTKTEDGNTAAPGTDGGAPQVHCIDFTTSGGVCMTYTP